jgi:hypothetical protein
VVHSRFCGVASGPGRVSLAHPRARRAAAASRPSGAFLCIQRVSRRAMWWVENVGGRTFRPSAIPARPCPARKPARPGPFQLGFTRPSSPRQLRILILIDARVRIVLPINAISTEARLKPNQAALSSASVLRPCDV